MKTQKVKWTNPKTNRVLTNTDSACLKSTPLCLSVECKIAELRVSGKPIIIVHEKMFEVIADSDCILHMQIEKGG